MHIKNLLYIPTFLITLAPSLKAVETTSHAKKQIHTTSIPKALIKQFDNLNNEEKLKTLQLFFYKSQLFELYLSEKISAQTGSDSCTLDETFYVLKKDTKERYCSLNPDSQAAIENLEVYLEQTGTGLNYNSLSILFKLRKKICLQAQKFLATFEKCREKLTKIDAKKESLCIKTNNHHSRTSRQEQRTNYKQRIFKKALLNIKESPFCYASKNYPKVAKMRYLDNTILKFSNSRSLFIEHYNDLKLIRKKLGAGSSKNLVETTEKLYTSIKKLQKLLKIAHEKDYRELQSNMIRIYEQSYHLKNAYRLIYKRIYKQLGNPNFLPKSLFAIDELIQTNDINTMLNVSVFIKDLIALNIIKSPIRTEILGHLNLEPTIIRQLEHISSVFNKKGLDIRDHWTPKQVKLVKDVVCGAHTNIFRQWSRLIPRYHYFYDPSKYLLTAEGDEKNKILLPNFDSMPLLKLLEYSMNKLNQHVRFIINERRNKEKEKEFLPTKQITQKVKKLLKPTNVIPKQKRTTDKETQKQIPLPQETVKTLVHKPCKDSKESIPKQKHYPTKTKSKKKPRRLWIDITNKIFTRLFQHDRVTAEKKGAFATISHSRAPITSLLHLLGTNNTNIDKLKLKPTNIDDNFHVPPLGNGIKKYLAYAHSIETDNNHINKKFHHKLRLHKDINALALEAKILPKFSYRYYINAQRAQEVQNLTCQGIRSGAWIFIYKTKTNTCFHQCFHEFEKSFEANKGLNNYLN